VENKRNYIIKRQINIKSQISELIKTIRQRTKNSFFKKKQKKMKIFTFVDFVEQLNAL